MADSTGFYYTTGDVLVFGRTGHNPSSPSLIANVAARLVLCPLGILLTIAPMRLMWRNGELAAGVFLSTLWISVTFTILNAAIWHDENFDDWWPGIGLCDIQVYMFQALTSCYSLCACAIMQNLSRQVSLTRVAAPTPQEKRRHLIIQALIVFAFPLLQIVLTPFVIGVRFSLLPVRGCLARYQETVVYLIFDVLPGPISTLFACYFGFKTWRSFRAFEADTSQALSSNNSAAAMRRQRARRKLYFAVLCILIPYTPVTMFILYLNIWSGMPWNYPVDYHSVHNDPVFPFNSVSIYGYTDFNFFLVNNAWVPVAGLYISFAFLGTTKEAINMDRRALLAIGLGRLFPVLHKEYDPDRFIASNSFLNSRGSRGTRTTHRSTLASSTVAGSDATSRKGSLGPNAYISALTNSKHHRGSSVSTSVPTGENAGATNGDVDTGPRRPPSTFRRWFSRFQGSTFRRADPELALERPPAGVGFNWLAASPSLETPKPASTWTPSAFASHHQPGASDASDVPMSQPATLTTDRTIYDGQNTHGPRVFSTHVWADENAPRAPPAAAAPTTAPIHGRRASSESTTSAHSTHDAAPVQRGAVRVERIITSHVTG